MLVFLSFFYFLGGERERERDRDRDRDRETERDRDREREHNMLKELASCEQFN